MVLVYYFVEVMYFLPFGCFCGGGGGGGTLKEL